MDLGLKDKVVLITGASKGIGKALAVNFAKEKAKIAICSRNLENLKQVAKTIEENTGSVILPVQTNLERYEDIKNLAKKTLDKFGRIDILVNNTGGPPPIKFIDTTEKQWQKAVDQLLMSIIHCCYEVVPIMKNQGWGRIINMTSIAAKQPIDNLILSNTIRSGIHGLTKTLSNELAEFGITVNAVCPGFTLTERVVELAKANALKSGKKYEEIIKQWEEQIPIGRLANTNEIAYMVLFYASDKASYITGNITQVDGGFIKSII
jgi:3-oxoacyl-[acyl-carrier protein] reductase